MRIAIGCDDTGFPLKEQVSVALEASGHDLLDLGTFSTDPVDHPDYARAVGQAVLRGFVDAGMLICGSGAGASIAANKIRGIRASLCHDPEAARLAREEDDANVLCLGAREVDPIRAVAIAMAWLGASFSGEERFARKISKIALLEGGLPAAEKAPPRPAATSPAARPPARETRVETAPRPLPRMPAEAPITSPPRTLTAPISVIPSLPARPPVVSRSTTVNVVSRSGSSSSSKLICSNRRPAGAEVMVEPVTSGTLGARSDEIGEARGPADYR